MPSDEVIISDPTSFKKKWLDIQADGAHTLHIVVDFDQTLTANTSNEEHIRNSSWGVFESTQLRPKWFAEEYLGMFTKYSPMLWAETAPMEERNKQMDQWYMDTLDLAQRGDMRLEDFTKAAKANIVLPRDGMKDLFHIARELKIPVIVFSAGQGDFIESFLRYHDVLSDTVHVISNFYRFDGQGAVVGYMNPIVHSLNKNEGHPSYNMHALAQERPNILLMGDFTHDIHMADGEKHKTILSMGILKGETEKTEDFKKAFDVVIAGEGSFRYPVELLGMLK
ncbi:MAG: 5-nucleotidase [Candidatus Kaiserbacteria bacterium]|nr:5-nucleotidase [Candidatus Kaiserbacteria bacterium]